MGKAVRLVGAPCPLPPAMPLLAGAGGRELMSSTPKSSSKEEGLIRRIVERDESALAELYDEYAPLLFSLLAGLMSPVSDHRGAWAPALDALALFPSPRVGPKGA